METKNLTDAEILERIENYIDNVDAMPNLSKEDKSWRTDGFSTGVIIQLLLEIREKPSR